MYLFTETHLFPSPWWGLCSCTPAVLSFPSTLNIDQPFWGVPGQSRVPGATEPVILHQLKIRQDLGPEFTVAETGSRSKIFLSVKKEFWKLPGTLVQNGTWKMLSRIYRIYNVYWKNYFQVLKNYYGIYFALFIYLIHGMIRVLAVIQTLFNFHSWLLPVTGQQIMPAFGAWKSFLDWSSKKSIKARVSDPDPDWIRIQTGQWIRNPDPDPGGQKWPTKVEFFFESSCFEVLDGLFCELQASSVTWTYFMEA